ncbi:hypothetical protein L484_020006 [Morus notabilis]|uniref:Uncharacterized protein n=1 Tax=Morus notabilis TaxID=981085 RepID=W9SZT4_9ROSA|nr:hypothetical protein L484_020006 [Morus notabilis]
MAAIADRIPAELAAASHGFCYGADDESIGTDFDGGSVKPKRRTPSTSSNSPPSKAFGSSKLNIIQRFFFFITNSRIIIHLFQKEDSKK